MKSMKIEINESQSVGDVVWELERLGYRMNFMRKESEIKMLETWSDGAVLDYKFFSVRDDISNHELTTLSDLRKMERVE